MKFWKLASAVTALVLSTSVNAALLSLDYVQGSGDNWITYDTETGLDWLDVTLTVNQSFDEVRTGTWYQRGFRHATMEELQALFQHAGTPDDGFDTSVTYPTETLELAQLLGPTLIGDSRVTVSGFTGTDFFGNQITLENNPIGSVFSVRFGKLDYLDLINSGELGEAHFTGGSLNSSQSDINAGSYLVRTSVVPVPAAAWLFGSGLIGLAGIARRKA